MIEFPTDVETIGLLGDVHGNTKYTVAALDHLDGVDVVIQLGDFGYGFTENFLNEVNDELKMNDQILMFVDGNHENFTRLYNVFPISSDGVRRLRDRIWHLPRGFRWEWSGVSFLALGGAHSVDRQNRVAYLSWWPEELITYGQAMAVANEGHANVMFTHDCPDEVDIPLGDGGWIPKIDLKYAAAHRKLLGHVVDEVQPAYLFHGHYHVEYEDFREKSNTRVYGLGCDGMPFNQSTRVINLKEL